MIDVQRMMKDIKKIAGEANTMVIEIEVSIISASINNWMMNAMNISGILEDLLYLVQSDMKD